MVIEARAPRSFSYTLAKHVIQWDLIQDSLQQCGSCMPVSQLHGVHDSFESLSMPSM